MVAPITLPLCWIFLSYFQIEKESANQPHKWPSTVHTPSVSIISRALSERIKFDWPVECSPALFIYFTQKLPNGEQEKIKLRRKCRLFTTACCASLFCLVSFDTRRFAAMWKRRAQKLTRGNAYATHWGPPLAQHSEFNGSISGCTGTKSYIPQPTSRLRFA